MKIGLAGITRNGSETTKDDGQLSEMINLRHDGATLKPIGTPKEIRFVNANGIIIAEPKDIYFVNTFLNKKNWIAYYEDKLWFYGVQNENTVVVEPKMIMEIEKPKNIVQIGKILCISSESRSYYALFDSDKYIVLNLQDDLNIAPEIKLTSNISYFTIDKNSDWQSEYDCIRYGGITPGYITANLANIRTEGHLFNPVFVRLAFKLYDGSYLLHTAPILLYNYFYRQPQRDMSERINGVYCEVSFINSGFRNYCEIAYYDIMLKMCALDISRYKDIIKSLDVFICEVQQVDYTDKTNPFIVFTFGSGDHEKIYVNLFSSEKLDERIASANIYRKVRSFTLDELKKGINETIDLKKENLLNNLEQQETLADDEYSHDNIFGNMFIYNSKLHLGNIKSKFYNGYNPQNYFSFGLAIKPVKIIKTDLGDILNDKNLLCKEFNIISYLDNDNESQLVSSFKDSGEGCSISYFGNFISYPANNVSKIILKAIFFSKEDSMYYYAERELKLLISDAMNMSCFIEYETVSGKSASGKSINNKFIEPIIFETAVQTTRGLEDKNVNPIEITNNKLKVSATNNPFYFPVEQTYTIGNGSIVNMAVATMPISQGQFGQFPLYVLCSDGIYSLNVGNEKIAYTTSSPVNRDIITGGLTNTDDAVIFVSGKKIKLLSGGKSIDISADLQGDALEFIMPNDDYFIDMQSKKALKNIRFEEYISNTNLAYNYYFNELYLFRTDLDYFFVYDIKNRLWGKRTGCKGRTIENYPNLYFQNQEGVLILSEEELAGDREHSVVFRTRPLLFGEIGFKKLVRLILRCLALGRWRVRVAVSNDGINFHHLISAEYDGKNPKRDIQLSRTGASYQFFVIELTAIMNERSYVNFIEADVQKSFGNRLR